MIALHKPITVCGPSRFAAYFLKRIRGEGTVKRSLFEKYGGFATWRKFVSAFYDEILENDMLKKHFRNVNMERLIDHQTKFVVYVTGGPAIVPDENLSRAHRSLGITQEEFDEMVEVFSDVMDDFEVEEEDQEFLASEILKRSHLVIS